MWLQALCVGSWPIGLPPYPPLYPTLPELWVGTNDKPGTMNGTSRKVQKRLPTDWHAFQRRVRSYAATKTWKLTTVFYLKKTCKCNRHSVRERYRRSSFICMNCTDWEAEDKTSHNHSAPDAFHASVLTFHGPRCCVTTVVYSHLLLTNNLLPSIEFLGKHSSPASVARLIIMSTAIILLSLSSHSIHIFHLLVYRGFPINLLFPYSGYRSGCFNV